ANDVAQVHGFVRQALERRFAGEGGAMRLIYGGSVKPDNAAELMGIADVNGALVGGASLKAAAFLRIIAAAGAWPGSANEGLLAATSPHHSNPPFLDGMTRFGIVLGAAAVLAWAAPALAATLDQEACAKLKAELSQLELTGARGTLAKGPEWAKANL